MKKQLSSLNKKYKRILVIKNILPSHLIVLLASFYIGCTGLPIQKEYSPEECIKEMEEFLHTAPVKTFLVTLDKKRVPLKEFFSLCALKSPYCVLYPKFYWWKNEIREIVSNTDSGSVKHKVRVYHNLMSACYPETINPLCMHGDVAEFYDENDRFMGLAVYMGQGLYCPLHYSKYEGKFTSYRLSPL